MSKHTPGPWELHDDEGWFMLGHKNRYVELAGNGKEAKANRALIARAPELLEENERHRDRALSGAAGAGRGRGGGVMTAPACETCQTLYEVSIGIAASLAAAIYLLEKGGKKAAPSNTMFEMMLNDYRKSLDEFRKTVKAHYADTQSLQQQKDTSMTDDLIKRLVDRFLGWRLPEDFNPDGGISFEPIGNKGHPTAEYKRNPYGTNLFSAAQAEAMVRYLLEGITLPQLAPEVTYKQLEEAIVGNQCCGWCKDPNHCPCEKTIKAVAELYGTPIPPADPVAELEAAWRAVEKRIPDPATERMSKAIAAVKAGRGK